MTDAGLRVLVVDDNRDAAETLAVFLEQVGNQVRTAGDGLGATAVAAEFKPHVLLLDIGLPDIDGYEVARLLRREPWGAAILLVAVTGRGGEEDRRQSRAAGFDEHLVKPVDPVHVLPVLARLSFSRGAFRSLPRE